MAKKITELDVAASVTSDDLLPVVDLADTTTKKATVSQIMGLVIPTGSNDEVLVKSGSTGTGATNVKAGSGYISIGATPATTGSVRLTNATSAYSRNAANDTNYGLFGLDASNELYIGSDHSAGNQVPFVNIRPSTGTYFWTGSANVGILRGNSSDFLAFGAGAVHTTATIRLPHTAADVIIGIKDNVGSDQSILYRSGGELNCGTPNYPNNLNGSTCWFRSSGSVYVGLFTANGWQFGNGATTTDFGSGVGVIGIDNAGTNPTTNPTAGGILYADGGAGKWRGSSGTVTTFGPADLDGFKATSGAGHCPTCGTDFAMEWANDEYGGLTVCMKCLTDELGDRPWIVRRPKR